MFVGSQISMSFSGRIRSSSLFTFILTKDTFVEDQKVNKCIWKLEEMRQKSNLSERALFHKNIWTIQSHVPNLRTTLVIWCTLQLLLKYKTFEMSRHGNLNVSLILIYFRNTTIEIAGNNKIIEHLLTHSLKEVTCGAKFHCHCWLIISVFRIEISISDLSSSNP